MNFAEMVDPLLRGQDLSPELAEGLMTLMMDGQATESQIGSALTALRIKGCTAGELAAFAGVLRSKATRLDHSFPDLVDTCGTGGGCPSFNLSTAAAIIASSAGVRIAKHGNRGVTSACGSADVLEALGVKISLEPHRLTQMLDEIGLAFMFAPAHHSAMKHVGPARKELGFRTVFNQLGPLANPAGASRQLIGVYDPSLLEPMGAALQLLGTERALVVHGGEGLDEISPSGKTYIYRVWNGEAESLVWRPEDLGLRPLPSSALEPGVDPVTNAAILREAITEAGSLRCQAVLPSAAAAIWLARLAKTVAEAVPLAREAVSSGRAAHRLEQLIEETNRA